MVKQTDIKRWWLACMATRKNSGGDSILSANQTTPSLNSYPIIQSCNDLPYETFKKCCVDKAFHLLGDAPVEVLEDQWIKLFSEFCVISEDAVTKVFAEEYAQMCVLESKIIAVKVFCSMLVKGYDLYAVKHLRNMGYPFPFSAKSYINDIERVVRKLGNDEVKLKMLLKNIESKQSGETEDYSYSTFDNRLADIEDVFKVQINPATLSTQMYAIKLKRLKQRVSDNQNKNQAE